MYAWEVFENGEWNIIAASVNGSAPMPLVTTRPHLADMLGLVAVDHHDTTGLPIRKVHYRNVEVLREVP